MAFANDYPVLAEAVHDIFDTAGDIKLALSDGRVTVDEIVEAIPDDAAKETVRRLLNALKALPDEFSRLMKNPWAMMTEFAPYLMAEAQKLFK